MNWNNFVRHFIKYLNLEIKLLGMKWYLIVINKTKQTGIGTKKYIKSEGKSNSDMMTGKVIKFHQNR